MIIRESVGETMFDGGLFAGWPRWNTLLTPVGRRRRPRALSSFGWIAVLCAAAVAVGAAVALAT